MMRLLDKKENQSTLDRLKHQMRQADALQKEAEIEAAALIAASGTDDLWTIRTELQMTLYELIYTAPTETLGAWFKALRRLRDKQEETSVLYHAFNNTMMYAKALKNRHAHA